MINNNINILFVGTGPISQRLQSRINALNVERLKKNLNKLGCPDETWDFILENDLIFYDGTFSYIQPIDLPEIYWKYFTTDITSFDLDKYRIKISNIIKKYFPNVNAINYTTVDWQILLPNYCNTTHKIIENDIKVSNNTKLTFVFKEHHMCTFQDLIKDHQSKYDAIWFIGCCFPNNFIDNTIDYIINFKNSLYVNGLIFHMDPVDKDMDGSPILDLIDMKKRQKYLDSFSKPSGLKNVKSLTKNLVQINTGVYKFL